MIVLEYLVSQFTKCYAAGGRAVFYTRFDFTVVPTASVHQNLCKSQNKYNKTQAMIRQAIRVKSVGHAGV
jgi:hypothetical protein